MLKAQFMKRTTSASVFLLTGALLYACSSGDGEAPTETPLDDAGGVDGATTEDSGTSGDGGGAQEDGGSTRDAGGDGSTAQSPLSGAAAELALATPGARIDGIQWHTDALYFTLPNLATPVIVRFTPPMGTVEYVKPASGPLGITFDEKAGSLLFADSVGAAAGTLKRLVAASATTPVVPTDVTVTFAAGSPSWASPNDVVVRKSDGTIYVTDPGYQAGSTDNGLYRVKPSGEANRVANWNGGHPNGVALSEDGTTLFVSLTEDAINAPGPMSVIPTIVKYTVAADGSVGEGTKFAEVGPANSAADGLAVDKAGNVYVATKSGVAVFGPDGKSWGSVATPNPATNLAFGGADGKTLYIATDGGIWRAGVLVAGVTR